MHDARLLATARCLWEKAAHVVVIRKALDSAMLDYRNRCASSGDPPGFHRSSWTVPGIGRRPSPLRSQDRTRLDDRRELPIQVWLLFEHVAHEALDLRGSLPVESRRDVFV